MAGLVFGHPDDEAPDYGKVGDLGEYIRDGVRVLIAKPKGVISSFVQQVKSGWLPGRSISVLPDGTLEHVGFLPANKPPAVRGMLPAEFQGGNGQMFYSAFEPEEEDIFAKFKSWFSKELAATNGVDQDLPGNQIEDEEDMGKEGNTFTQADLDAAVATAAKKAEEELKQEFAEEQAKAAKKDSDKAVQAWVDGKVKAGIIPPRWVDGGIVKAFQALDHVKKYEFCEGEKDTPLDFFKGLIEDLENYEPVSTKEFATRDTAPPSGGKLSVEAEVAAAHAFMASEAKQGRTVGIAEAVTAIRQAKEQGGE
ncbi:MAG: hypothetical protein D3910_22595 [Candidatus Electrothrix sp. ATG2]|nr:hypothetical protein [Candidatus Electrothrix sp. ATG2]